MRRRPNPSRKEVRGIRSTCPPLAPQKHVDPAIPVVHTRASAISRMRRLRTACAGRHAALIGSHLPDAGARRPARGAAPASELCSHHLLEYLLVEIQVRDQALQVLVLLLELLQARHLGGHQPAILHAPSVIRLHRYPRLPADLLDPHSLLRLAQDERNLLLAELRSLHDRFPGGSMKPYPRIFLQWVVQVPGSRSQKRRTLVQSCAPVISESARAREPARRPRLAGVPARGDPQRARQRQRRGLSARTYARVQAPGQVLRCPAGEDRAHPGAAPGSRRRRDDRRRPAGYEVMSRGAMLRQRVAVVAPLAAPRRIRRAALPAGRPRTASRGW